MPSSQNRVVKLCGRCQSTLRRSNRMVRRVGGREGEQVECELCGDYKSGGYYEVGPQFPGKERAMW